MQEQNQNQDFDMPETENYKNYNDKQFSHELLLMQSMRKVLELSSQDLLPGIAEKTIDKFNNQKITYKPDLRLSFINAVKSCEMVLIADYDLETEKIIKALKEKIKTSHDKHLKDQWDAWMEVPKNIKFLRKQRGFTIHKDYFNTDSKFYQAFLEGIVENYREMFQEFSKLTKRLKYFKGSEFKG